MKRIYFSIAILILSTSLFAQREEVPSLVIVEHDFEWYKKQYDEWSRELRRDSTSENAWKNYYMATRYCRRSDSTYNAHALNCIKLVDQYIPNTVAAYLIKGWELGVWQPKERIEFLQKGLSLAPDHPQLLSEIITHEVAYGTEEKLKEYCMRFFNTNHYSPAYYNYNYNVLVGLPQNAILFSFGDLDSYPVWVLQQVLKFRKDITLINVHMLNLKEYREKVFTKIGVPMNKELEELIPKYENEGDRTPVEIATVKYLFKNTKSRIHIALTGSDSKLVSMLKDNLYLTGLSYEYSEKPIENITILNNAFKKMKLDYLEVTFMKDRSEAWNKVFNINYLLPMTTLYKAKKTGEERDKLYNLMMKIAQESGKEEIVKKSLGL